MNLKKCNKCFKTRPVSEFNKKKDTRDGYKTICRKCCKLYDKERLTRLKWSKVKFTVSKPFQFSILLEIGTRSRKKYDKQSYNKTYYRFNKERLKEYSSLYKKTAVGKSVLKRVYKKRRDQVVKTADGSVTVKALKELKQAQDNKCFYCGTCLNILSRNDVHLDHVKPLAKGGSHTLSNVVFACRKCNQSKGTKTPS